ncbi:MAG: 50S ribosomal protein L10 [Paludibacteraceae bacterium]|nr:50S ribosomal protein L10 [Paludibacteraceae bacterium]MBO7608482.1 50S ribosomal protein L10 [Paludibacteraceae bacterium]MBP5481474.1 50S ribosomal protein L10 [Paludibacteraceae bacterium]MBR4712167.1 50S ribosomal protein L10 [Paludibacteraceae bacterium]MBR5374028.1 50S ribosomal protein L10 [Paludibacteraceae bacterium]
MKKEDKGAVIEQIFDNLNQYAHFYIADAAGLTADLTSDLRRACFKNDIKLFVVKNTLLKKALERKGDFSPLFASLEGPSALFLSDTGNAPAKLIKEFSKKNPLAKPALKAAYVEESFYVGADQLDALVSIKSKNELIGDIITLLQSPAKNVISALQSGGSTIHGVLKTLSER